MKAFVGSTQVDCMYIDFSKAYDRISNRLLIAKMEENKVWTFSGSQVIRVAESIM